MLSYWNKPRTVKLHRRGRNRSFGFSVRGGREHGLGIFVSEVHPGSEASLQGLKPGDEILRVNGHAVGQACHHEIINLLKSRNDVTLKVRRVGVVPIKDGKDDEVTWLAIGRESPDDGLRKSSSLSSLRSSHETEDVKLYISCLGKAGLGCSICKGPADRPGIFVQSTKTGSIARDAGLRPGDQVLACNGTTLHDMEFSQAVLFLKSQSTLDLVIRRGAGLDLFPNAESSGYNSSSSSLAGDAISEYQSGADGSPKSHHSAGSQKRLSVVTEEEIGGEDRPRQNGHSGIPIDKFKEWGEVEQEWSTTTTTTVALVHQDEWRHREDQSREDQRREDQRREEWRRREEQRLADERRLIEEQQQRLKEEAQRLEREKRLLEEQKRSLSKTPSNASSVESDGSVAGSGAGSSAGSSVGSSRGSLTSAILSEITRRHAASSKSQELLLDPSASTHRVKAPSVDEAKRQQHAQLMQEFQKAHKRMFSRSGEEEDDVVVANGHLPTDEEIANGPKEDMDLELLKRLSSEKPVVLEESKGKGKAPPPPPPMPSRGRTQPPSSPVPDYDSREKSVEVTSLDSLSLVDPPTDPPQPPKTYFDDRRPIVSINAYSARPSPNRLDFLPSQKQLQQQQQDTLSEDYRVKLNRFDRAAEDLRSELTETLSRANLRNRSSSVENLLEESRNGEHPDPLKKPISTLTKGCTSASNLADSTDWAVSANGTPPANGTANGSVAALASRFEPSRGTSVTYNFQKTGPVVSRDEDNRVTIAVKCTPRNGMSTVNSILKLKPSQRPTALSKTISFDDT